MRKTTRKSPYSIGERMRAKAELGDKNAQKFIHICERRNKRRGNGTV